MRKWLQRLKSALFTRVDVKDVVAEQNFQALRLAAEHEAAAEYHAALAGMYRQRAIRTADLIDRSSEVAA